MKPGKIRLLLAVIAALAALVVQSGELGSSDSTHRLQTAHSFWTSEPEVFPDEYPEFGVHGRGGRLHSWFGLGQPLLLLPLDIAGTYIERLAVFDEYNGVDPSVRDMFVSGCSNILLTVLTALVCFQFLCQLKFTRQQAVAGVLALLFCTTRLHYTQNMMENNYIMLLTLCGIAAQYTWLRTGNRRALLIGSAAFGLNLLTRLTTGLDLLAGAVFLFLVLHIEGTRGRRRELFFEYAKVALPVYAIFILIDRIYQYVRFGSFFDTYVAVVASEYRRLDPALPAAYPWTTPFHVGFLGPLITPEKSIFLFDPLTVLTILIAAVAWKHFGAEVKAYLCTASLLLLAYIGFYARYVVWSGDFAWGDRYVSTAAELFAFISVPLLLRHRAELGKSVWRAGAVLIAISLVVQLASLAFWCPLEIYQMYIVGHATFVIGLRMKNIVDFALGKTDQWGLNNLQDQWDYMHIMTWNFLPFLLRRVGVAPVWVVKSIFAIWGIALGALAWLLLRLRGILGSEKVVE